MFEAKPIVEVARWSGGSSRGLLRCEVQRQDIEARSKYEESSGSTGVSVQQLSRRPRAATLDQYLAEGDHKSNPQI